MSKYIYIIDDNPGILDATSKALELHGYSVNAYMYGVTAINQLFTNSDESMPDLILMDVLLQNEDGVECCRTIKENSNTASIPVVLFSAQDFPEAVIVNCGASAFIRKPFSLTELMGTIERCTQ